MLTQATNQSELEHILRKAQRGEDIEKRQKRVDSLDEYFRRRNELLRQGRKVEAAKV